MAAAHAPRQEEMYSALMSGGLTCLSNCDQIQVKERFNLFEAIHFSNATKSRYRVFQGNGDEIFFGVEQAVCGQWLWPLQTFLPDCAPWNIDIYLTENRDSAVTPGESAFTLRRPCTPTCCCFNRPVVDVTDVETGVRLGSIKEPFTCWDFKFLVQDTDNNTVMRVRGDCCEWGLCCPYPCGPCAKVDLNVLQTNSGTTGSVQKKAPLCWNFLRGKEQDDTYRVDFGTVQAPEDKALLMALAILIDFKYFHMPHNSDDSGEWQWLASDSQDLLSFHGQQARNLVHL